MARSRPMSLLWLYLSVCIAFVVSSQVKERQTPIAGSHGSSANVSAFFPMVSPSVSLYGQGGGGYNDLPPDDPSPPRRGFYLYGEECITAAFYALFDITWTIIQLADMFWELLLSTWRFLFVSVAQLSPPWQHTQARHEVMLDVLPPAGPTFQIQVTELDSVDRIHEKISNVSGIQSTAFKIFKNGKKVRHLCQVLGGGLLEIAIPLLGGTKTTETASQPHNNAPSRHETSDPMLRGEICDCGGACNCRAFTSSKGENCDNLPAGHIRDAVRRSKRTIPDDVPSWVRSKRHQNSQLRRDKAMARGARFSQTSSAHFESSPLQPVPRSPAMSESSPLRPMPLSPAISESSPLRPMPLSPAISESSPLRPMPLSPAISESSPLRPMPLSPAISESSPLRPMPRSPAISESSPLRPMPRSPAISESSPLRPMPAFSPIHPLESDRNKSLNDVFAFNEPDTPYSPIILSPRNLHQEDDDASSNSSNAIEATEDFSDSDMVSTDSDNLDSSYFAEPHVRPKPLSSCTTDTEKRSKLLSRATHSSALRKVVALDPCCKKKCSSGFSKSTIKDKRMDYFSAPSRNEWIKQKLGSFQVGSDKLVFQFKVDGSEVCREAWCRIYGINKNTYYRDLKDFRMGLEWAGLRRGRSLSSKCLSACVWFGQNVAGYGDNMPHKAEIWLPYSTRKVDIFNKYAEYCEKKFEPYCCQQSFYNMWKTFYPHVAIKQCSLFTKCTICVRLGRDLAKTRDPVKRTKIKLARQEHDARQMAERLAYYHRREAARHEPDKYLSLIIDGMDQAKTYLPHFVGDKSKDLTTADQMKVHVSGIISHGHGLRATYIDFFEYSHDSNLTLNLLLKLLAKLSTGNPLPPILFIQADNCYRENKNKFMLAFLDMLVHMRIFREIQLSFLMVGHTHEDIDQMFSRVADKLRHQEARTPEQLISMMPECNRLRGLYNIRDWLKPAVANIKGQSQPGQFRFRLSKEDPDVVDMFYRKGQGQSWKKLKNGMFKRSRGGKPIRPKGIPKIIPVSFNNRNIDAQKVLNEQLPKWAPYLDSDLERSVWERYLRQMVKAGDNPSEMAKYSRVGTGWVLPKLPKCAEEILDDEPAVPDDLQRLLEKEQENPEITVSGANAARAKGTACARRRLVN